MVKCGKKVLHQTLWCPSTQHISFPQTKMTVVDISPTTNRRVAVKLFDGTWKWLCKPADENAHWWFSCHPLWFLPVMLFLYRAPLTHHEYGCEFVFNNLRLWRRRPDWTRQGVCFLFWCKIWDVCFDVSSRNPLLRSAHWTYSCVSAVFVQVPVPHFKIFSCFYLL